MEDWKNSPSRKDDMTVEMEDEARCKAIKFLFQIAQQLDMLKHSNFCVFLNYVSLKKKTIKKNKTHRQYTTIYTACYYFHKFFFKVSLKSYCKYVRPILLFFSFLFLTVHSKFPNKQTKKQKQK